MEKSNGLRLIVDYSVARAQRDGNNRDKGIKRLMAKIRSGRLTKANLNNRGCNKILALDGDVRVSIDRRNLEQDKQWDGLKGYLTNSARNPGEMIGNYR